jgi:DNA-binding FrmR family transcriptional regulator
MVEVQTFMKQTINKTKSLKCLKQAQGTLAKVMAMIEEGRYCPEIIQQADSAIGLLKTAKRELLAGHLDTCVVARMKENKKAAIDELIKIYNLSS